MIRHRNAVAARPPAHSPRPGRARPSSGSRVLRATTGVPPAPVSPCLDSRPSTFGIQARTGATARAADQAAQLPKAKDAKTSPSRHPLLHLGQYKLPPEARPLHRPCPASASRLGHRTRPRRRPRRASGAGAPRRQEATPVGREAPENQSLVPRLGRLLPNVFHAQNTLADHPVGSIAVQPRPCRRLSETGLRRSFTIGRAQHVRTGSGCPSPLASCFHAPSWDRRGGAVGGVGAEGGPSASPAPSVRDAISAPSSAISPF